MKPGSQFLGFSGPKWMPTIYYLYVAAIIFSMSCLAIVAFSLLTLPPPSKKVKDFTWQRKIYDREKTEIQRLPIMWNYRYLSVLLLGLLALTYYCFGNGEYARRLYVK
jgi:hypothetical protein